MSKTNAFLLMIAGFLFGVIIGILISPDKKRTTIGTYNRNLDLNHFDFEEDSDWDEDLAINSK